MASLWTEHRSPTGRLYWYNASTATSSWERPDDLKTPAERALASTPWKEYQTAEGRKYWHHSETKETTWTLPEVVREAIEKVAVAAPPAPSPGPPLLPTVGPSPIPAAVTPGPASTPMHPTFVPASQNPGASPAGRPPGSTPSNNPSTPANFVPPMTTLPPRPVTSILHSAPVPAPMPVSLPDFKTPEEAERAFIGLLRVKGVNPTWTWEQTMRDIITEPLYKALDTLAARKAAWEKFIDNERKREKENREKNISRVRASWNAGLDSLAEPKSVINEEGSETKLPGAPPKLWWTYERLRKELEIRAPDVWKLGRDDEERKILWEDYLSDLRHKDTMAANQLRGRQQEKLTELIRAHQEKLDLVGDLETIQWRVAQEAILRSEDFQNDEDLRKMDDLDMLIVFEEEVKRAEKESSESKAKQKEEKRRTCRKTRAAYIQLLHELKLKGEIQARTTWKEIYPLIEEDERYTNLLGMPGSSPLDLFWDLVDDLDQDAEEKAKMVEGILAEQQKVIIETTELDDVLSWLDGHADPAVLDKRTLTQVFMLLHEAAVRTAKDERRRAEKRLRNQIEDLRYALKKLTPPVELDTPYDEAVERFSHLPEFKLLEGQDEGRKEAYNRYMERLKEKASLEKKNKRKDEDQPRSDYKKKPLLQHSDDEGSILSSTKRKRKDLLDDDKPTRHSSPRSGRREDTHSSPRGAKDLRDERDHDRSKERDRGSGRDRDFDRDHEHRGSVREDELEPDSERGDTQDDHSNRPAESDRSRNRDRDRSRDDRDHRDRTKDRGDERDRGGNRTSMSQTDDRDRRRKDYDADRHTSRHHRSRKDRDYEERDRGRRRSSRYDDEDHHIRERKSDHLKDDRTEFVDKRARSVETTDTVARSDKVEEGPDSKRVKINEAADIKLSEKTDGEEGELDG
ncbi:hypothetical protein CROQUDRAFT_670079 [Cronartium quercuum f. sp. fusiforme G11]|uniref:Uncharacterized protein n=1 Tax=Cronartium quercuum f. sp. fusiforme G11 TaxID=708437 RepID=A0A9P6TET6_9BASI|nr:hypothetical protein CROQUDRAFT_670079 [Cronartium quercuum f. sp. fusiforme G11]